MDQNVCENIFRQLPDAIIPWYAANKRQLPWREDKDPYHIWLSEIMLQQTRVEAVKGYYTRFLQTFPTIEALANAEDERLHKLWEGLGYYNRVRNLKKAARFIMDNHNGVFPTNYQSVLALPGIGVYTAGAICSIAFDLPTPAVDGNVLRVAARLTDDDSVIDTPIYKQSVHHALERIYPQAAGEFTQGLMELGATLCGPNRKADCVNCPCKGFCRGYAAGSVDALPKRKTKAQRKEEAYTVFLLECDGAYALEKRPNKGLLAGLWQFPNVSGRLDAESAVLELEQKGLRPKAILRQVERTHIFTHIRWNLRGFYFRVAEQNAQYVWMSPQDIILNAALPTAFRQFFEEI